MTAEPTSLGSGSAIVSSGIILDVSPSPRQLGDPRSLDHAVGDQHDEGGRPPDPVLAERLAAAVALHEPGWRLPRASALARRYGADLHDIGAAVNELVARHLIRRLPDGQLYRSSPAEYLLPLEGISGLGTRLDPMGIEVTCSRYRLVRRVVPADVSWTLKIPPGELVSVVQLQWLSKGQPSAVSTTYLAEHLADYHFGDADSSDQLEVALRALSPIAGADARDHPTCRPRALAVQFQPALPSVAKTLRLSAGQPVLQVTVRFDDVRNERPAAMTVAVLRPEMFRVALEWQAVTEAADDRPAVTE